MRCRREVEPVGNGTGTATLNRPTRGRGSRDVSRAPSRRRRARQPVYSPTERFQECSDAMASAALAIQCTRSVLSRIGCRHSASLNADTSVSDRASTRRNPTNGFLGGSSEKRCVTLSAGKCRTRTYGPIVFSCLILARFRFGIHRTGQPMFRERLGPVSSRSTARIAHTTPVSVVSHS